VTAPDATAVQDIVVEAVTATADTITAFGDTLKDGFNEWDMQEVCVAALVAAIEARCVRLEVKPNRGVKFEEWPGVGPVDVALLGGDAQPTAFVELKWGSGNLYNCVWDLAKMGVAVARAHAPGAYLVAGAPGDEWRSAQGCELFESQTWNVPDLMTGYAKHWSFWKRDVKTHPLSLPATIETQAIATAATNVRGDAWELRCAAVVAEESGWIGVPDGTPD
jgi:hypothetical protein